MSLFWCFFLQGTSITSMSSSTSLPTRSASAWAGPLPRCCSLDTRTSSAIRHWRTCSPSSLEAPVRLLCVCVLYIYIFFLHVCFVSNHLPFCSHPSSDSSHQTGPRSISRDWQGVRPPVDAAMVGRVHLSPKPTPPAPPPARRRSSRRRRPSKKRAQRRRQSRHALFDDFWSYDDWFGYDYADYSDIFDETLTQESKSTPVQNVYFFKKGMKTWSYLCPLCFNTKQLYEWQIIYRWASSFNTVVLDCVFLIFVWCQINTTEWISRPNVWTLPTLLTHDPLQNTGWAASMKRHLMHQGQRRDRPADQRHSLFNTLLSEKS